MKTNHNQIIFAREYRLYSQTELASKIQGLSQSKLSNIEKGIESVNDELLSRISQELNFPTEFFYLDIHNKVFSANYRKKRITQSKKNVLDIRNKLYGYLVDSISRSYVEYPPVKIPQIDLTDGFTPSTAAKQVRRILSLNDGPIKNIITLFENNGVIVIEDGSNVNEFDGVSFISDNGNYIVVINKNMPNDRKRFTLAHELGHLVMHNIEKGNYLIDDTRDIEKEAHEFASEFLMPEDGIRTQLYNLRLSELSGLKQYWLTSMASILYRATKLNCIDSNTSKYLNVELSRRGYKKEEPVIVPIDSSMLFKESFKLIQQAYSYDIEDMGSIFHLSKNDINDLFNINSGALKLKMFSHTS